MRIVDVTNRPIETEMDYDTFLEISDFADVQIFTVYDGHYAFEDVAVIGLESNEVGSRFDITTEDCHAQFYIKDIEEIVVTRLD